MQVIAEVKTDSPFGWHASKSWEELFEIANQIGDIISIHTDRRWNGSFELLKKARTLTNKPILAKGIHTSDADITKALTHGADFVLVVGRLPAIHTDVCLIEANTIDELKAIPTHLKAVWNSRDLNNGELKPDLFVQARKHFSGWLCQASNIAHLDDVDERADAILVGTHLPSFAREKMSHGFVVY